MLAVFVLSSEVINTSIHTANMGTVSIGAVLDWQCFIIQDDQMAQTHGSTEDASITNLLSSR
jgi:hypothetical protein